MKPTLIVMYGIIAIIYFCFALVFIKDNDDIRFLILEILLFIASFIFASLFIAGIIMR